MPCDNKSFLKASQFAVCVVALVYKVWTSWESQRVALSLQKESRDWTQRRGFAEPTSTESIFMDLSFGAFTLVTFCLMIGHLLGDPRTVSERMFMVIGFITMVIIGGILITSTDDMPDRLYDNAIILGVLAFVAGVLFLTDAGTKCAAKKKSPPKPVVVPKREVEIVPPRQEAQEQQPPAVVVEQRKEEPKKEETKKEETTQTQNGIKSVEIRIKDPSKNWPVYGRALSDGLAEAERVDRLLQEAPEAEQEPVLLHSRKGIASVQPSPVKHTSSFYIGGPFSWRRLNDQGNK